MRELAATRGIHRIGVKEAEAVREDAVEGEKMLHRER